MKAPITDRQAQAATKTTTVGGAPGLILRVLRTGKFFYIRRMIEGKEVWRPLGKYPDMSLVEARKAAVLYEVKPTKPNAKERTLEGIVAAYIKHHRSNSGWSNPDKEEHDAWVRMEKLPKALRRKQADEVTPSELAEALSPIMLKYIDAGQKLRSLIAQAYRVAKSQGKLDCVNPAGEELSDLLPGKRARPICGNYPFVIPERVPALMARLYAAAEQGDVGSKIAMLEILTCSRQANIIAADASVFDTEAMTMRVPRSEMKVKAAKFDRIAPISKQAAEVLAMANGEGRLFDGRMGGKCDHAYARRAIAEADADDIAEGGQGFRDPISGKVAGAHGVARASFDTWAKQPVKYCHGSWPDWVVEACEDHFTAKYGGAYMRELPTEEMRPIMDAWGEYCFSALKAG